MTNLTLISHKGQYTIDSKTQVIKDIIEQDPKLWEIYSKIISEYTIKYVS